MLSHAFYMIFRETEKCQCDIFPLMYHMCDDDDDDDYNSSNNKELWQYGLKRNSSQDSLLGGGHGQYQVAT